MTAAATAALEGLDPDTTVLLCDGDLADTAGRLVPLLEAVESGSCDLAVAAFERQVGGGLGFAMGYARNAIRKLCGCETTAPISGQRAMSAEVLADVLPFAPRLRDGDRDDGRRRPCRLPRLARSSSTSPTAQRAQRSPGFIHRGRQLRDFVASIATAPGDAADRLER